MEIKGTVKQINDLTTDKIEKKQVVITIDNGKYPTDVAIDFLKDKVKLLENAKVGQIANVKINVVSREYQGKWYTNVNGWDVKLENDLMDL